MNTKAVLRKVVFLCGMAALLAACGGGGGDGGTAGTPVTGDGTGGGGASSYAITAVSNTGGTITPPSQTVAAGESVTLTVTPDAGYRIGSVGGSTCVGMLNGDTYTTGPIDADCTITATFASPSELVVTSTKYYPGGTVNPPSQAVVPGSTASFTITPYPNYRIGRVTGCGGTLSGDTYTTGAISSDCDIAVFFDSTASTSDVNNVTVISNDGGIITPPSQTVAAGSTATFTITPNTDNLITSVTGCGGTLNGNTYTTAPVSMDCRVYAYFAPSTHTVSVVPGAGGTISPNAAQIVSHGKTTSFTVTPDTGYSVSAIYGCNGILNGNTYTTASVTRDCTVTVSFIAGTTTLYNVKVSDGLSVGSGDGGGTYSSGTTVALTARPNSGYSAYVSVGFRDPLDGHWLLPQPDYSMTRNGYDVEVTFIANADYNVSLGFGMKHDEPVVVTASSGAGGTVTPFSQMLKRYYKAYVTLTPNNGYAVDAAATLQASTCRGEIKGFTFITDHLYSDCMILARFKNQAWVDVSSNRGTISPMSQQVLIGSNASIGITPELGWYVRSVSGCNNGHLDTSLNIYTTGTITEGCLINVNWDNVAPPSYYSLNVSAYPEIGGKAEGGGTYATNSLYNYADLSATAYPGYAFTGWTKNGVLLSSDPQFKLLNSAGDKNIVANFVPLSTLPKYTVTFVADNIWISDEETREPVMSMDVYRGQAANFGAMALDRSATRLSMSGCGVIQTSYDSPSVTTFTGPITADCTVTVTAY